MSKEKNEKRTSIIERIKGLKNKETIIAVVLGILALLIFFGSMDGLFKGGSESKTENFSTEEYVDGLENKLSQILSKIEGAGEVKVMITVESGMEIITANEEESGKPILVNGKVVILKEMYPKVKGVLIVAKGADSIKVKMELLNATVALLDVDSNCVEIFTMNPKA